MSRTLIDLDASTNARKRSVLAVRIGVAPDPMRYFRDDADIRSNSRR
jgi:hypothetical protein